MTAAYVYIPVDPDDGFCTNLLVSSHVKHGMQQLTREDRSRPTAPHSLLRSLRAQRKHRNVDAESMFLVEHCEAGLTGPFWDRGTGVGTNQVLPCQGSREGPPRDA